MRTSFVGCVALALLLVAGCDKRKAENPGQIVEDEVVVARDTNAPFTPPEIRRVHDSTAAATAGTDSTATRRPVVDSQAAAPPKADMPKAAVAASAAPQPPVVEKAPVPPKAEASPVKASAPATLPEGVNGPGETGDWVVQVGIHKSESGARAMVGKLGSIGIPAYVVQAAANAGLSGSYWRVRVGRFVLRADAQKFGESVLKPAGYSFWVDRKANEAPAAGGTP